MELPAPRYVAISSDGELSGYEMLTELSKEKIAPIMYYTKDDLKIVPVFESVRIAKEFAKRNTNRKFAIGVMEASDAHISQLSSDGFAIKALQWPNKRQCSVHVIELSEGVSTHNNGRR